MKDHDCERIEDRLERHEHNDVSRFANLEARVAGMEKRVARGAFLGIIIAEGLAQALTRLT